MARGHAGLEALDLRVSIHPVLQILLLPRGGPRLVRNLLALDDAETRGHPADGAEAHHGRGEHDGVGQEAGLAHERTRRVRLQVPVRRVVRLPDAAEIGLPRRARHRARRSRWHLRGGALRQRAHQHDDGCSHAERDEPKSHAGRTASRRTDPISPALIATLLSFIGRHPRITT